MRSAGAPSPASSAAWRRTRPRERTAADPVAVVREQVRATALDDRRQFANELGKALGDGTDKREPNCNIFVQLSPRFFG